MKLLNNFLSRLKQAIGEFEQACREFEEGLLLGLSEQHEMGDDSSPTSMNRFLLVAFAAVFLIWAIVTAVATNAGYIQ
jgi:hypothetical protein